MLTKGLGEARERKEIRARVALGEVGTRLVAEEPGVDLAFEAGRFEFGSGGTVANEDELGGSSAGRSEESEKLGVGAEEEVEVLFP